VLAIVFVCIILDSVAQPWIALKRGQLAMAVREKAEITVRRVRHRGSR
jgi:hypothetical protein